MIPQDVVDWTAAHPLSEIGTQALFTKADEIGLYDEPLAIAVAIAIAGGRTSELMMAFREPGAVRLKVWVNKAVQDPFRYAQVYELLLELCERAGLGTDLFLSTAAHARRVVDYARMQQAGHALIEGHHFCNACEKMLCNRHHKSQRVPQRPEMVSVDIKAPKGGLQMRTDKDAVDIRFNSGQKTVARLIMLRPINPLEALGMQAEQ